MHKLCPRKHMKQILTDTLLLYMQLGGSVCNGVGVKVAVLYPDIFRANRFLYIEVFHCVSLTYKRN